MRLSPVRGIALALLAAVVPACKEVSGAGPIIDLSATSLLFTASEGAADPADQTVTLKNIGDADSVLSWTSTSDQPWLSMSPSAGSQAFAGSTLLTVSVDSTSQAEAWTGATSTTGAPTAGSGRAVWTGSAMLVWGDDLGQAGTFYDPVGNAWSGSMSTTGAPASRILFSAVWTGTEMIVWGGITFWGGTPLATGGRYNPATDEWAPMSTAGAPSARFAHTAVWTGSRMIVWGGDEGGFGYRDSGGVYDPDTDSWTGTTATAGAPSARGYHAAVWTGTRMIIWGGENPGKFNTGALYDPVANAWVGSTSTTDAPAARSHLPGVWTGTEMIVWGGGSGGPHLNSGGRYNPALDKWTGDTTLTGAPDGRASHSMVWTGSRMIVWGGEINGAETATGGLYGPPLLAEGSYIGTITLTAPLAFNSPRTITVNLTVGP